MARSDIQTFWKFLTDVGFTGKPSSLAEDEVRQMCRKAELFEHEIETVLTGPAVVPERLIKKDPGSRREGWPPGLKRRR